MTTPNEHATARAEWRAGLLVALVAALAYLPLASGRFTSSDELAVFEMTRSLFEDGDLTVPPIQHTGIGATGERFSLFAPGQSVLALPHYALATALERALPASVVDDVRGPDLYVHGTSRFSGDFEVAIVSTFGALATGLLVGLFFRFQRELGASARSALVATGVFAFGTYVVALSSYFLRHATETALILASLLALLRWHHGDRRRDLAIAATCAASVILVRVPSAVFGAAFGIALLASGLGRLRRGEITRSRGGLVRDALAVTLPLAAVLGVHVAVNLHRWGTPLSSPMTAQTAILDHPLWRGAAGLLWSPGVSLFAYSPVLLLSPAWLLLLWRRERLLCATALAVFASFVAFVGSYAHWPGLWSAPGPRYLYQSIPLLLLPLGIWLDAGDPAQRPARFAAVVALACVGALVNLAFLLTPWEATVAFMDYARQGPEGPFLWSLSSGPIPGTFRTLLALDERSPWLWKLAAGWPGHPAAPGRAALWLVGWAALTAPAVWALARTARTLEPRIHGQRGGAS